MSGYEVGYMCVHSFVLCFLVSSLRMNAPYRGTFSNQCGNKAHLDLFSSKGGVLDQLKS